MRGSHDGSYDVAHALRDGRFWRTAGAADATPARRYDLVVVGGGISGLAAAYFYRARDGATARILILDNHDDFGGHAKRNEFRPGGHAVDRERRHRRHFVAVPVQPGGARADVGDRDRLPALSAEADKRRRSLGLSGTAGRVLLRQGNLRRRSPGRRHAGGGRGRGRAAPRGTTLGGVSREDAAVARRRSRTSPGSRRRRSTTCRGSRRPRRKIGSRESATRTSCLKYVKVSPERDPVLSDAHARPVRHRDRRGRRARVLGVSAIPASKG